MQKEQQSATYSPSATRCRTVRHYKLICSLPVPTLLPVMNIFYNLIRVGNASKFLFAFPMPIVSMLNVRYPPRRTKRWKVYTRYVGGTLCHLAQKMERIRLADVLDKPHSIRRVVPNTMMPFEPLFGRTSAYLWTLLCHKEMSRVEMED